ncbi:hypothetical protein D0N37_15800 [Pseudoalteromonas piscicida]|nr:hypothetical protein D0N37_15800 [Pseudoalteromonas piscicida]
MFTRMTNWMFELFINFFESGTLKTSSSDSLKTLFFMPTEYTILFGDGLYLSDEGEYYKQTDVGFLRLILFGGLIHNLVFYFSFIYLFYVCIKLVYNKFGFLAFCIFLYFLYCFLLLI